MRTFALTSVGVSTPAEKAEIHAGSMSRYVCMEDQNHFWKLGTPSPTTSYIMKLAMGLARDTYVVWKSERMVAAPRVKRLKSLNS